MSKAWRKIKGFTLIELLVTSSLTVLIVSMAYFAYSYLFGGLVKYQQINENVQQHYQLEIFMNKTFSTADVMEKKGNKLVFKKDEREFKTVLINPDWVLFTGSAGTADTLKLKIKSFQYYWNGDSVLPDKSPVERIKLDIDFSGKPFQLIFEKRYDSEKLIRLDSLYNTLK